MKVTAQWIADQCGVSRGTVDRVVNGRPNVSPEVRERLEAQGAQVQSDANGRAITLAAGVASGRARDAAAAAGDIIRILR